VVSGAFKALKLVSKINGEFIDSRKLRATKFHRSLLSALGEGAHHVLPVLETPLRSLFIGLVNFYALTFVKFKFKVKRVSNCFSTARKKALF
jgi:hypothetical protein